MFMIMDHYIYLSGSNLQMWIYLIETFKINDRFSSAGLHPQSYAPCIIPLIGESLKWLQKYWI